MTSQTPSATDLSAQLIQIGLHTTAGNLDDFIARAAKGRWSGRATLEEMTRMELHEQEGHPLGQSFAFRSILERPGSLRLLHGLSRAAQVTGIHALLRATGLTRWLGTAGALMEHVGPLPRRTAHDTKCLNGTIDDRAPLMFDAESIVAADLADLLHCHSILSRSCKNGGKF